MAKANGEIGGKPISRMSSRTRSRGVRRKSELTASRAEGGGRNSKNGRKEKKRKKISYTAYVKIFVFLLLCIVAVSAIVGISQYNKYKEMKAFIDRDTIYDNIYVSNYNVGGLTKEQAKAELEKAVLPNLWEKTISLNDKEVYVYSFKDFGATYDFDKAIDDAYNYARTGSVKERYKKVVALESQMQGFMPEYVYDSAKVDEILNEVAEKVYVAPTNPTMEKVDGKFVTKPGKVGYEMDIEATKKALIDLLETKGENETDSSVFISTKEIQPEYDESVFDNSKDNIGAFSTAYSGGDSARITNMKVAAERINGTVIFPGEIFSTNEHFGESTAANGYLPAPTIVKGKIVEDYGGGVCQVSTTLYNAVLYSELEVTERQNHSLKVGYADYGFDATLAGDYIDFKFKNSTDSPIYIEAYLTGSKVICNIYGHETRSSSRSIKFENSLVETVEPGAEKITYDDTLDEGVTKTEVTALKGYRYKVYKLIYENGQLKEKVLINSSYYKPREAEITVGTKKTQAQEVMAEASGEEADSAESEAEAPQDDATSQNI